MRALRLLRVSLALVGVVLAATPACHRPTCDGALSDDDVRTFQQRFARGENVCPELAKATLSLDADGVLVNGARVNTVVGDSLTIPLVIEVLEASRTRWQKLHPDAVFAGTVTIELPPNASVTAGAGVLASAATAGFTHQTIQCGDTLLDLDHRVLQHATAAERVVHVDRAAPNGELRVRFGGGAAPFVVAADESAALALVDKELADAAAGDRALVIRSAGSFRDALALARTFLAHPSLSHAVVAFDILRPPKRP